MIIENTLNSLQAKGIDAELCRRILTWRGGHQVTETYQSPKVLEHKLGLALYLLGEIPIRLRNGRFARPSKIEHLNRFSYSSFDFHSNRNSLTKDKTLYRLMMTIARMSSSDRRDGPNLDEFIDEIGPHPLIVARYGRAISYDDILPLNVLMRRYMTGQRSVTIRIGEKSMPLTPESIDDCWVLNPEFIRLWSDERLYFFWKRARSAWPELFNRQGRTKEATGHLGGEATYEDVLRNPKARFIKMGSLPSEVLMSLGISTMPERKSSDSGKASKVPAERVSEQPFPKPREITYEEFRGYVPRGQFIREAFKRRVLHELRGGALPITKVLELAEFAGFKEHKDGSLEQRVSQILTSTPEVVERLNLRDSDPANPTPYIGLRRFLGDGGEPVRTRLYSMLASVIRAAHPEYQKGSELSQAGRIIHVLEEADILTTSDLQRRVEDGTLANVTGLGGVNPRMRARLNYVLEAHKKIESGLVLSPEEASLHYPARKSNRDKDKVDYAMFRTFVKKEDYMQSVFLKMALKEAIRRPVPEPRLVRIAKEVGVTSDPGRSVADKVRQMLKEHDGKFVEQLNPDPDQTPNPRLATPYWGLSKYLGQDGKPVRNVLYNPFQQAIRNAHPGSSTRSVNMLASFIIGLFEESGVLTQGDLKELVQLGDFSKVTGLVSKDPRQRANYGHALRALEIAGLHHSSPSPTQLMAAVG